MILFSPLLYFVFDLSSIHTMLQNIESGPGPQAGGRTLQPRQLRPGKLSLSCHTSCHSCHVMARAGAWTQPRGGSTPTRAASSWSPAPSTSRPRSSWSRVSVQAVLCLQKLVWYSVTTLWHHHHMAHMSQSNNNWTVSWCLLITLAWELFPLL